MELSGAVQTRHLVFETSPAPSWYPPSRPILVVSESQRQLAGRTAHPSRCPQTIPKEPSAFKYTWSTIKPAVGEDLKPAKNDMACINPTGLNKSIWAYVGVKAII
ncbi:hypothetical protein Vi05172_g5903 [Venturia inaequalis]|nr:hypothetical protein Vi05172_g5903 [Venturia inaequalis]